MAKVFLGLGANMGDREMNLVSALRLLNRLGPLRRSALYETEPVGMPDAMPFLNCVLEVWTDQSPRAVLSQALTVERTLGRVRSSAKTSRTIDVDILFYDDYVIRQPGLEVPHPRLHERAFVLVPLAELEPGFVHPVLGRTVNDLLGCVDRSGVRRWQGEGGLLL